MDCLATLQFFFLSCVIVVVFRKKIIYEDSLLPLLQRTVVVKSGAYCNCTIFIEVKEKKSILFFCTSKL